MTEFVYTPNGRKFYPAIVEDTIGIAIDTSQMCARRRLGGPPAAPRARGRKTGDSSAVMIGCPEVAGHVSLRSLSAYHICWK